MPATKSFRYFLAFGLIGGGIGILFILWILLGKTGWTSSFDNAFGRQHLATSVALIELHKIRNGSYPAQLKDLEYVQDWDPIAIQSVEYVANPERTKYAVRVVRGWTHKPTFEFPEGFWRNTGYDPELLKALEK